MKGLPRNMARPVPKRKRAIPTAMSLTRGRLHTAACRSPSPLPAMPAATTPSHGDAGPYHAEPWRSGQIRDSEPAHRPHDQGPFEPEIHATALFRKRLAETDEEIGGRDAGRAADDGDEHTPPAELQLVHARLRRQRP